MKWAYLALCLVLASTAHAGEKGCSWRLTLPLCCPDDYRSRPIPCLPPAFCPCGCYNYCSKPPPCLPPEYCPHGCDDYCPKPLPHLGCVVGECYPTDGCGPKPKFWWLDIPWWGKRLCGCQK